MCPGIQHFVRRGSWEAAAFAHAGPNSFALSHGQPIGRSHYYLHTGCSPLIARGLETLAYNHRIHLCGSHADV
jgi:hypothetical protein